jgi:hypothetical protein
MGSKVNGFNQIGSAECHPEKAGVGGSIPSLATISFQRLSAISVPRERLTGVQIESKLGFHSNSRVSLPGTGGTALVVVIESSQSR